MVVTAMQFAEQKTAYRFTTVPSDQVEQTNLPAATQEQIILPGAIVEGNFAVAGQMPTGSRAVATSLPKNALKATGIWLVASAFFALVIFGASNFAQLGYDWGYTLVKNVVGQISDGQGEGAMFLYLAVIPTVTAGLLAGYMQGLFGGNKRWRVAALTALAGIGIFLMDSTPSLNEIAEASTYLACMASVSFLLSIPVARLAHEIKLRTRAVRLQSVLLLAVLPWWLLVGSAETMWEQGALYTALVFAASLLAPLASRSRTREAVFSSVFFATMPVTLFNLTNIGFTLFSMVASQFGFFDIGWRATLSACLITLVTIAASAAGGACGGLLVCNRSERLVPRAFR
jgi:hypothetical protein